MSDFEEWTVGWKSLLLSAVVFATVLAILLMCRAPTGAVVTGPTQTVAPLLTGTPVEPTGTAPQSQGAPTAGPPEHPAAHVTLEVLPTDPPMVGPVQKG